MILSVIVPLYNIEQYLPRCIDSILQQTFTDFELILVDDGSEDSSGKICDQYAAIDSRIKVIHKKHVCVSDARNVGIKNAKGKYISFIDSDDFILQDAFEKLLGKLITSNAEIVAGNSVIYISEDNKHLSRKRKNMEGVYKGEDFLRLSLQQNAMSMCVWLNIYSRKLIVNSGIEFKEGIFHEDELWTPLIFLCAERVVYLDLDFYMHFMRQGSRSNRKIRTQNGTDLINVCYELAKTFDQIENDAARIILNDNIVTLYLSGFYNGKLLNKKYNSLLDNKFLQDRMYSRLNKIKVRIFVFNKRLYYFINFIIKKINGIHFLEKSITNGLGKLR